MRRSSSILIFFILICTAVALRCIIQEKKSQEEPEIHVIHLDDGSKESSEPEVVSFQIPEKRKRAVWDSTVKVFCKNDDDCEPGEKCIAYLRCVKSTMRDPEKNGVERKT